MPQAECEHVAPVKLNIGVDGPILDSTTNPHTNPHMIYYDGQDDSKFPTHDPCGTNNLNIDAPDPRAAIYVR